MNNKEENDINKTVEPADFLKRKYLRILIRLSSLILLLTITLSWIFYPDTYFPLKYYISHLGGIDTVLGNPNTISRYIFMSGVWIVAIITFLMVLEYFKPHNLNKLNVVKGIILVFMMVSSIIIGLPYDSKFHLIHSVGAIAYYISFNIYVFLCQFTRFRRRKITFNTEESQKITPDKYYVFLMLAITISYFIAFFMDLKNLLPIIQKLIVLSSMFGVIILDKEDL